MFKIIEFIIELLGWLKIVLSPLLAGVIIGAIVYLGKQDTVGFVLGISIAVIGLAIGVIWATRILKREGTVQFNSRVIATPELDKKDEEGN